jgi:hypothetical protein
VFAHARWDLLDWVEVNDKIVLDSEHGVGGEPWVVFGVYLGNYWLVLVVCDLEGSLVIVWLEI